MKVMCVYSPGGSTYVRTGWGRVFAACGHRFMFWKPELKSAFDAFSEFEPDVFIGTTYDLDNAQHKCIASRPQMKVALFASAWGPYLNDVDTQRYPLVVVQEAEKKMMERLKRETGRPDFVFIHAHDRWLHGTMAGWKELGIPYLGLLNAADLFGYFQGKPQADLECDLAFVGGYWGYKATNINRFLLPLCHPSQMLNIKIFGNQKWPVAQYLGGIEDREVPNLFASAKLCPNVSEPHSTDLGWDIIERPFKVLASGGVCISDYVEEARDIFTEDELPMAETPEGYKQWVHHLLRDPDDAGAIGRKGQAKVLAEHTYFDRVVNLLDGLGMSREAHVVEAKKREFLEKAKR